MPSQQEVKWSQLKVGLIVLASVALLSLLLFLMTSASGMSVFSRKIVVTSYFDNSMGLKTGAPVELEGVTIGEVKTVEVTTDPARKLTPVKVVMKIDPRYKASLHTDSRVSLGTIGVLGDTVLDINSMVATGPELKTGDELKTLEEPSLQDVVKSSQGTIESLNAILAKINGIVDDLQNGKGTAGKLITDPTLYNQATSTVTQLNALATGLNSGKGTAGKLLTDPAVYDRLNDTVTRLDNIVASLDAGKGSAGKLLKDDSLYNNMNSSMAHANSLLAEADAGKGGLGLIAKDPAFAKKLNDTVTQLDTLLGNVNSGKGTIGQLATNDSVYKNLDKALVSTNDLVTAVRQDPKKYLVIHMKIF
jgi:phospholipid/cholesterol/gamma-HCH transport system substrate-binding protein